MDSNLKNIRLSSFNCKNVIRSVDCIRRLCTIADVIALQETWLLPHDVPFLGSIDDDFAYVGKSAVDTSAGILRGRPYGGVALLWRKSAFPTVSVLQCNSDRLVAIRIEHAQRSMLVFSVYMPTDAINNIIEFTECISEVIAISDNSNVESVFVLGDFNAHPGERFAKELLSVCGTQSWSCVDMELLPKDTYTFESTANGALRWLDHCVAAIGFASAEGYDFKCGGSLISARWLLTAAHCSRDRASSRPVVARLGDRNINPKAQDDATPVDVPIRNIIVHPDYHSPVRYNDIALMELATDVDLSNSIRPACLWPGGPFHEDKAIATGWGVVNQRTQEKADLLQKVSLTLLENSYCDRLLRNNRNRHWQGFRDSQLCAGEVRGGMDTCQGDSGAPLQIVSKENQCIYHLIGLTSFGYKCAEQNKPSVYTRVSSYVDWIESVVWPDEYAAWAAGRSK